MKLTQIKLTQNTILIALCALVALVALTGTAQAACPYTGAEQVFRPWGDNHNYVLAPDGGFENGGAGWTLRGGARTVDGNETHFVNEATDSRSLSLPAGSSAVSPPICMSLDTPILRTFVRNTGDPTARLQVEASYKLLGLVRTRAVSTFTAGAAWAPGPQMSTVLTLSTIVGTLIPSAIQVKITPLDSTGQWQVDDFYVDPFARR